MKQIWWWGIGLILIMIGVIVWQMNYMSARIVLCDVGQGDSLLLTHRYSQLMIDTGSDNGGALACLGEQMPFWDRYIEVIMITHTDEDHFGALKTILSHFKVGQVITTQQSLSEVERVVGNQSSVLTVSSGDVWRWGNVTGHVLWPERTTVNKEINNLSLVQRVELPPHLSLWLSGDAGESVELALLEKGLVQPTTILKVAHHGSASSTSTPFLAILQPHQAWISVGNGNRFGHPDASVLQRFGAQSVVVRRTDLERTISLLLH